MSGESFHVDTESEYEEKRQELIADAAETKQELDQAQNQALDAISKGGDLEEYETVTLGELELEVKAWLPGDVTDVVKEAAKITQDLQDTPDDEIDAESFEKVTQSMTVMLEALAGLTKSDDYNMRFWREFYDRYGPEGLLLAAEEIVTPAMEGLEERQEGVKSFQSGSGS